MKPTFGKQEKKAGGPIGSGEENPTLFQKSEYEWTEDEIQRELDSINKRINEIDQELEQRKQEEKSSPILNVSEDKPTKEKPEIIDRNPRKEKMIKIVSIDEAREKQEEMKHRH
jgi:uncharacterized membrane protein YukC